MNLIMIRLALTANQALDDSFAVSLLKTITKSSILLADKVYDPNDIRAFAKQPQTAANIPLKSNRDGSYPYSQCVIDSANSSSASSTNLNSSVASPPVIIKT